MKHNLLLIYLIGAISVNALSQSEKTFSNEQLKEDFQVFQGSLEDFHPGLYWYRSQEEMNRIFTEAYQSLEQPLTEKQFFRTLATVSAKIGCGHTQIELSEKTSNQSDKYLPINLMYEDGTAYCIQNNSLDANSIQPGNKILSINGLSMDSLFHLIMNVMWGDGFIETGKMNVINKHFSSAYGYFIGKPDQYIIEYINQRTASIQKIKVQALTRDEIKTNASTRNANPHQNPANLQLYYVEGQSIALLKIKQFFNWKENGKTVNINKRMQETFEELHRTKPKNLIIDLRDNGGGKEPWRLLAYFMDEEFLFATSADSRFSKKSAFAKYQQLTPPMRWMNHRIWHTIYPSGHASKKINDSIYLHPKLFMVNPFKPLTPRFEGNVYVLINGGSFSATSLLVANMKSRDLATFIGEETGGSFYGNTAMSPTIVTLPNSGIRLDIPLVRFKLNVEKIVPMGRGTLPDYEVRPGLSDILDGIDLPMDFTIKLIEERATQSKTKL